MSLEPFTGLGSEAQTVSCGVQRHSVYRFIVNKKQWPSWFASDSVLRSLKDFAST